MGHSHVDGWKPEEIGAFADSLLGDAPAFPRFTEQGSSGGTAWARFETGLPVQRAEFIYTTDTTDWVACRWLTQEASIEQGTVRAPIPSDCCAYFVNLVTDNGLVASTAMTEVPVE